MGDVQHGKTVIQEFGQVCSNFPEFQFAFKLQYRDLDSFIHSNAKGRDDVKHVKRFEETRLTESDFNALIDEIRTNNFLAMSTPFDENSVDIIERQNLDFIKIASCSFTDWPLWERVAATNLPVIASTAGAELTDIDQVVSYLQHREKQFGILHCVGEYPTADSFMHLGQLDFLKARYPGIKIGFSTHEEPSNVDIVKLSIAKGAEIHEKHVGLPTEKYKVNAYSVNPGQLHNWLLAARYARSVCGISDRRRPPNANELASLRTLRRGVFARRNIPSGSKITIDDIYFAFPPDDSQLTANDWSKYSHWHAKEAISKDQGLFAHNTTKTNVRELVWDAAQKVKEIIRNSNIVIPGGVDLELSHHFGLERFQEFGLTIMTIVNQSYCKKLLVSLPGQHHPEQFHKKKQETFLILHGNIDLSLDGKTQQLCEGDVVTIEPGTRHAWVSKSGAIIEEISSTHYRDDSYYTDEQINRNQNRKTALTYWMD